MNNRSPGTCTTVFKRKCKVYDVEQKKMIGEFESIKDTAEFLGIALDRVVRIIKFKHRNKSNKLGLTITIR